MNALETAIFINSLIYFFKKHNYVVETREEIYRYKMYRFHLCIAFDKSFAGTRIRVFHFVVCFWRLFIIQEQNYVSPA